MNLEVPMHVEIQSESSANFVRSVGSRTPNKTH